MALARPRLWLVYKLIGEHCLGGVSAAPRAPAAAAPAAAPLTLLDRLRLMGIAEAGATRVKPGKHPAGGYVYTHVDTGRPVYPHDYERVYLAGAWVGVWCVLVLVYMCVWCVLCVWEYMYRL
jgi:hypothetical protein